MSKLLFLFIFCFSLNLFGNNKSVINTGIKTLGLTGIQAKIATNTDLKLALALGIIKEITFNKVSVTFKIYKIAKQGSCVPETHFICGFQYLLSTYTLDEYPEVRVYDLGTLGEILEWKKTTGSSPKYEEIKVSTQNYPRPVLKRNKKRKKLTDKFWIKIYPYGSISIVER